jgi:hypothetical protein
MQTVAEKDYYQTLGIDRSVSLEDIKGQYRKLALKVLATSLQNSSIPKRIPPKTQTQPSPQSQKPSMYYPILLVAQYTINTAPVA